MHEMLVMAQPTTEKGSAEVQRRLNDLHEFYQDLMFIKTPLDRERERKQRIKDSWEKVRSSTRKMAKGAVETSAGPKKKPLLKINWENINARRKLYADKFLPKKKEEEGG